jgi:cytochrome c peroxidase
MKEEGFLMSNKRILFAFLIAILAIGLVITLVSAQSTLTPEQELGKAIFFDQNLSLNSNQACASCHAPESGWTGPENDINAHGAVYEGSIAGAFGNRKPPSSAYATQSPILYMDKKGNFVGGNFWDGRATGEFLGNPSADQALGPFLNPKEQALPDAAMLVAKVCTADYSDLFLQVWGVAACDLVNTAAAYSEIGLSIAAYEGSLEVNAFTSKYDYSLGSKTTLTQQERLGFALFMGKGKCNRCHVATGKAPLFTDYTYDNLGIPKNPENPATIADPGYADPGLGGYLTQRADYAPYAAANLGKFKVPTLRNVGLGLPDIVKAYGHNGFFKSLEGIVHFYNTRDVLDTCPDSYNQAQALADNCWPQPEVSENLNTSELGDLGLTPDEEAAIVAFLKTLSDGYVP